MRARQWKDGKAEGAGIPAQRVARKVETVDIAPTIALLLGAKPPSASVGQPLRELVETQ